jgi:hypothetical protein
VAVHELLVDDRECGRDIAHLRIGRAHGGQDLRALRGGEAGGRRRDRRT